MEHKSMRECPVYGNKSSFALSLEVSQFDDLQFERFCEEELHTTISKFDTDQYIATRCRQTGISLTEYYKYVKDDLRWGEK